MDKTWTIKYTNAEGVSWRQGRYAQKDMAELNANLQLGVENGGLDAEVEPY